jgi:hypothetical protein
VLFSTRLTVAIDTPACFETSLIVIRLNGDILTNVLLNNPENVSAFVSAYMIIDVL